MSIFILVDCNNFFVSCERLFQPALIGRPVIVLSNNDGCVVARSSEAKQLGIAMGVPYFEIRNLCQLHRVKVFSSNFSLYGDISQRVMAVLKENFSEVEIYSIDEAFIQLPFTSIGDLVEICSQLRQKIGKWVGIPVSIGIGATKTLAKAANAIAKTEPKGVFELLSPEVLQERLQQFPVEKLWGIGRGFRSRLVLLGIWTAWQLHQADPWWIRKHMGVVGERIVYELRGVSCLSLEAVSAKKSITCSRSFGHPLMEIAPIAEAIATHIASACVTLREQESCAQAMQVFLEASDSSKLRGREHQGITLSFPFPMNDTGKIISLGKSALSSLFQQGRRYKKAGVMMLGIIGKEQLYGDLFNNGSVDPKREQLTDTVDRVNRQMGKRTLFYGAMGIEQTWRMRSQNRSRRYTTSWNELATAFAK